jgi:hypothetical protein
MTPNITALEDRFARLGIHLPDASTPFGAYVPAVRTGKHPEVADAASELPRDVFGEE